MSNPWLDLAEKQIASPVKARSRAAEKRLKKKLEEDKILFRLWKKWQAERREQLMQHEGADELIAFVETMTLEDADALIELIEHSPLRHGNREVRSLTLSLISNAIVYLRERSGLEPFDDPLPDEEPTAFFIVREMLN